MTSFIRIIAGAGLASALVVAPTAFAASDGAEVGMHHRSGASERHDGCAGMQRPERSATDASRAAPCACSGMQRSERSAIRAAGTEAKQPASSPDPAGSVQWTDAG